MKTSIILLFSFISINLIGEIKASKSIQSDGVVISIDNYNSFAVYSTVVKLDAEEIYKLLGKSIGSPIKAYVTETNEPLSLNFTKVGDKNTIQLFVSLNPFQSIKLQIVPASDQLPSKAVVIDWNKQNHNGSLSNGVVKLRLTNDKWDLLLDGSRASNISSEVLTNGAYYGWLDSISRGRVSDTRSFKPTANFEPIDAGLDGKGMISTRLSKIVASSVSANPNGEVVLSLKKQFEGYARSIDYVETYTLLSGSPVLKYSLKFINNGKYPVYVGYVGRGGFVYAKYGAALKSPFLQTEKVKNVKSETIRVAWVSQPIWTGLQSDNGVGLFVSSLIKYPKDILKGSMVWQFGADAFELPLVEHTQGQYPFTIAPGKSVESGLYITATSGGLPISQISKNSIESITQNKEPEICSPVSVYYNGQFKKFAAVSDYTNLSINHQNEMAALTLDFNKPYLLNVSVGKITKGERIDYKIISAKDPSVTLPVASFSNAGKQSLDLSKLTNWKGVNSFILQKTLKGSTESQDTVLLSPKPFSPLQLISPLDGSKITDYATYYRWVISPEAQAYELQMSDFPDMANPKSVIVKSSGLNYYLPKELPKDGQHYWRIRATSGKLIGEWSKVNAFETNSKHTELAVQRKISVDKPLFTIETPVRADLGKMVPALPEDLKPYFAIVVADKNDLLKQLALTKESKISVLIRSHHPSAVNDWQSLALVEKAFQDYPNVIGIQGGESLGSWYGTNESALYIRRLVELCAKYGKIIHEADGCYDENKWLEIYQDTCTANLIQKYKSHIVFSQKNNIFNKQLFTQSALFGMYLAGAIENTGAWEDGGWYWAQVGFKKLGESTGARTGELFDMPPIFWDLTFLMGLSRGATVFSMDGQGGVLMRGHYDPTNPKHRNQVLWSAEGEVTETFTRYVAPFLRAVVIHKMFVSKEELLKKVKVGVTYEGVNEIKVFKEDRYREFWPLFKGTYGFGTQGSSRGEVYEYFPNTGRYFFIPVLPPVENKLSDKIIRVPINKLQDPQQVTDFFNANYPESYKGNALVYQVGDILAIMNTHENEDVTENYAVPLNRGNFNSISGKINVHSYIMGKFENKNKQLWLQVNTNYPERNSEFAIACSAEPKVKVVPAEAIKICKWDAIKKELVVELDHTAGAVELTLY